MLKEMRGAFQTKKKKSHGNHTDCHPGPDIGRRSSHLALQQNWGYYPSGGPGLILLIPIILLLLGRI